MRKNYNKYTLHTTLIYFTYFFISNDGGIFYNLFLKTSNRGRHERKREALQAAVQNIGTGGQQIFCRTGSGVCKAAWFQ